MNEPGPKAKRYRRRLKKLYRFKENFRMCCERMMILHPKFEVTRSKITLLGLEPSWFS